MEIWKDIEGYEGLYQVSNLGRVKNLEKKCLSKDGEYSRTHKEKILKGSKDKDGYLSVCLTKNKKEHNHRIHRLVAQTFLDNPNNYPVVNHKNEIKDDNRVDNLEWCSVAYNNNYGTKIERCINTKIQNGYLGKGGVLSKKMQEYFNLFPKDKIILQFTLDGEFVKKWGSIKEAQNTLKCSHISECCSGKRKQVGGYKWHYHYKSLWLKKHIPLIEQKRKRVA